MDEIASRFGDIFTMWGSHHRLGAATGLGLLALTAAPGFAADLGAKRMPPEALPPETQVFDVIFGARFLSDYNFRGVSQSNRQPSYSTYAEAQFFDNFFYAGFTSYRVDLPTRPGQELDFTAGFRPKFGPLAFDIGFIYYLYPSEVPLRDPFNGFALLTPRDTDFVELAAKAAYSFNDQATAGVGVFYTPNLLGTGADATYLNGTFKYTLPEDTFGIPGNFAISAEFAHYFLGRTNAALGNVKLPDYNYGNVGISYTYGVVTLDVRFHDTDLNKRQCFTFTGDPRGFARGSGTSNWCGDAVIATLSVDLVGSKLNGIFAPSAPAAPAPMERGSGARERDATGQALR